VQRLNAELSQVMERLTAARLAVIGAMVGEVRGSIQTATMQA